MPTKRKPFSTINRFSQKKNAIHSKTQRNKKSHTARSKQRKNKKQKMVSEYSHDNERTPGAKRRERKHSHRLRRKINSHGGESPAAIPAASNEFLETPRSKFDVSDLKKNILGRFYMDGCSHCESMQEEWDILLGDTEFLKNVQVFDVEKTNQDEFKKEVQKTFPGIFENLNVTYPTIFKIDVNSGKIDYYEDEIRTAEKIKEWVNS